MYQKNFPLNSLSDFESNYDRIIIDPKPKSLNKKTPRRKNKL